MPNRKDHPARLSKPVATLAFRDATRDPFRLRLSSPIVLSGCRYQVVFREKIENAILDPAILRFPEHDGSGEFRLVPLRPADEASS